MNLPTILYWSERGLMVPLTYNPATGAWEGTILRPHDPRDPADVRGGWIEPCE